MERPGEVPFGVVPGPVQRVGHQVHIPEAIERHLCGADTRTDIGRNAAEGADVPISVGQGVLSQKLYWDHDPGD